MHTRRALRSSTSCRLGGWSPFTTRQNGVPLLAVWCDHILVLVEVHRVLSGTTVDYLFGHNHTVLCDEATLVGLDVVVAVLPEYAVHPALGVASEETVSAVPTVGIVV